MPESPDRPNIILIVCDDLGYGDIGCYGSPIHPTPRLNQLAAEGRRFTDFHMAASCCTPARAALMTGCYPHRVGLHYFPRRQVLFPGDPWGLSPNETALPALLKTAGYHTAMVGKWHLGDQPEFLPTRHGFDRYLGLPYSNDMSPRNRSAHVPSMPPLPLLRDESVLESDPPQDDLTDRYLAEAMAFIGEEREQPFFLYFAHMYVHVPIYAPHNFLKRHYHDPLRAAMAHLDACTGVLLDHLEALGLADNTLVLFSSDNGSHRSAGGSNLPLRGGKGTSWEGGFRVPLIARWPARIPAGSTCDALCDVMDLLPTFAAVAGAELPDRPIDGHDIGYLFTEPVPHDDPTKTLFYWGSEHETLDAVRQGRWKLFLASGELYDLADDVAETLNRACEQPEIVDRLRALAAEHLADIGAHSRPCGVVESPVMLLPPLTRHPLIEAYYD